MLEPNYDANFGGPVEIFLTDSSTSGNGLTAQFSDCPLPCCHRTPSAVTGGVTDLPPARKDLTTLPALVFFVCIEWDGIRFVRVGDGHPV
jgi:hypothetical protein